MAFEKIDWQPLESLTSSKLQTMADNDYFLFQRKIEGVIRNVNPATREARGNPTILRGNLVSYAEYREFSPGDDFPKDTTSKSAVSTTFEKRIQYPEGFFDPVYLPVVVASVGVRQGIRKVSYVLKDPSPYGFSVVVREHSDDSNFTEQSLYFVSFIVTGIKN